MMGKNKNILLTLLFAVIVIFSIAGCDFISGLKKEAKAEKKIVGYIKGYNPRIKEIEKTLNDEGFNPGSVDGVMDKQTRRAVKDFQKANRITATGFVDTQTKARLDALNIERAKKKQQEAQKKQTETQKLSPEKAKKIQQALKKAGFDPGQVNGIIGERTEKAIMAFQKSKGLPVDGTLNQKTWNELSKYFPKE